MSSVHTMPVNDLIEHDASEDCPCGPTAEPVEGDDGSFGWLHIHHSLDNREAGEVPRVKGAGDHNWEQWDRTPLGRGRLCLNCGCEDDGYQQPCKAFEES